MKKHLYSIAMLALFFVVSACSNDDYVTNNQNNDNEKLPKSTTTVELKLEGLSKDESTRAITYDYSVVNGKDVLKANLEKSGTIEATLILAHLNDNNNSATQYIDIKWKQDPKRPGYLIPAEKITVELDNSLASDKWVLASIIGGNVDKTKGEATFAPEINEAKAVLNGNAVAMNIPFTTTADAALTPGANNTFSATLAYKMRGTILCCQVDNKMTLPAKVKGFTLASNFVQYDAKFDLTKPTMDAIYDESDATLIEKAYTFSDGEQTLAAKTGSTRGSAQKTYLIWVMPKSEFHKAQIKNKALLNLYANAEVNETGIHLTNQTGIDKIAINKRRPSIKKLLSKSSFNTRMAEGKNYKMTMEMYRPELPVEYVSEFSVNSTHKFTTSQAEAVGMYQKIEADRVIKDTYFTTYGYVIPTNEMLYGLCNDHGYANFGYNQSAFDVEETVKIGELTNAKYVADYKTVNNISYAIKFKKPESSSAVDNDYRCAYKYAVENKDGKEMVVVRVRYLGRHFAGNIDNIANDSFWKTNDPDEIVKYIPIGGYINTSGQKINMYGYYWSDTRFPEGYNLWWILSANTGSYGQLYIDGAAKNLGTLKMGIRPVTTRTSWSKN